MGHPLTRSLGHPLPGWKKIRAGGDDLGVIRLLKQGEWVRPARKKYREGDPDSSEKHPHLGADSRGAACLGGKRVRWGHEQKSVSR